MTWLRPTSPLRAGACPSEAAQGGCAPNRHQQPRLCAPGTARSGPCPAASCSLPPPATADPPSRSKIHSPQNSHSPGADGMSLNDTAAGIVASANAILLKLPGTRLVVMATFPRVDSRTGFATDPAGHPPAFLPRFTVRRKREPRCGMASSVTMPGQVRGPQHRSSRRCSSCSSAVKFIASVRFNTAQDVDSMNEIVFNAVKKMPRATFLQCDSKFLARRRRRAPPACRSRPFLRRLLLAYLACFPPLPTMIMPCIYEHSLNQPTRPFSLAQNPNGDLDMRLFPDGLHPTPTEGCREWAKCLVPTLDAMFTDDGAVPPSAYATPPGGKHGPPSPVRRAAVEGAGSGADGAAAEGKAAGPAAKAATTAPAAVSAVSAAVAAATAAAAAAPAALSTGAEDGAQEREAEGSAAGDEGRGKPPFNGTSADWWSVSANALWKARTEPQSPLFPLATASLASLHHFQSSSAVSSLTLGAWRSLRVVFTLAGGEGAFRRRARLCGRFPGRDLRSRRPERARRARRRRRPRCQGRRRLLCCVSPCRWQRFSANSISRCCCCCWQQSVGGLGRPCRQCGGCRQTSSEGSEREALRLERFEGACRSQQGGRACGRGGGGGWRSEACRESGSQPLAPVREGARPISYHWWLYAYRSAVRPLFLFSF